MSDAALLAHYGVRCPIQDGIVLMETAAVEVALPAADDDDDGGGAREALGRWEWGRWAFGDGRCALFPSVQIGSPVLVGQGAMPSMVPKQTRGEVEPYLCCVLDGTDSGAAEALPVAQTSVVKRTLSAEGSTVAPAGKFTAGVPVSAVSMRRLFQKNRQAHIQRRLVEQGLHDTSEQEVAPSTASRADLEALAWLFPALHAGTLYATAEQFVVHCQSSEEHFISCEELPIIPLVPRAGSDPPCDDDDDGNERKRTRQEVWWRGVAVQCESRENVSEETMLSTDYLSWFSLLYECLARELPRLLSADGKKEKEDHLPAVTHFIESYYLSFHFAEALATRLSADPSHWRTSTWPVDELHEKQCRCPAAQASADCPEETQRPRLYVDWSSPIATLAEVAATLYATWRQLCMTALQRLSPPTAPSLLSSLLQPFLPSKKEQEKARNPKILALRVIANEKILLNGLPRSLEALAFQLASAIVRQTRKREKQARLMHLREEALLGCAEDDVDANADASSASPCGCEDFSTRAGVKDDFRPSSGKPAGAASYSGEHRARQEEGPGSFSNCIELFLMLLLSDPN